MATFDWAIVLARVAVILAAGLAVVPLVNRSARRRATCAVMVCGIILASVPVALQLLQHFFEWRPHASLAVLSRMDALGFALILFGVILGLRDMSRTRDELRKQNQALQKEAATDFLTGLFNRRQAEFLLHYGAARARRSGDPLGFVMIDLDHFKRVNDTHGHQAGDALLTHIGALLKGRIRESDILSRYGGEEFLVVLAEPTPEGVLTLAEDLRALIEQNPTLVDGVEIPITASFGVAMSFVGSDEAVEESIAKADAALYAAKALGRNRVVSWEQTCRGSDESAKNLIHANRGTEMKRPAKADSTV